MFKGEIRKRQLIVVEERILHKKYEIEQKRKFGQN